MALLNALRLATFTDDERWRTVATRAFSFLHDRLVDTPLGLTEALVALDFASNVPREIGIVWTSDAAPSPLLQVLRTSFAPHRVLAGASEENVDAVARVVPFMRDKRTLDGRPTAYVCERGRCELPTSDGAALKAQLAAVRSTGPSVSTGAAPHG